MGGLSSIWFCIYIYRPYGGCLSNIIYTIKSIDSFMVLCIADVGVAAAVWFKRTRRRLKKLICGEDKTRKTMVLGVFAF